MRHNIPIAPPRAVTTSRNDVPAAVNSPSGLAGNTPLLRVHEAFAPAGRGFRAKPEGFNPGGIKDRPRAPHGRTGPNSG
ncbi:hypothetical protein SSPS47_28690 [Streptomyces sp. S4.7]|nr:hypothetical protein SSPS47_28690 [Streptomyces sp. S4.7]